MHEQHPPIAIEADEAVVFAVWTGAVTSAAVAALAHVLRREAARHPGGVSLLMVWRARAPIPGAIMRRRIVEVYAELGARFVGVAHLVAGTGFWASAALSFVAELGRLDGQRHPIAPFVDLSEATRWLSATAGGAFDCVALQERVDERVRLLKAYCAAA